MESAIYCSMESGQRSEWNHGNAVYGIKPQGCGVAPLQLRLLPFLALRARSTKTKLLQLEKSPFFRHRRRSIFLPLLPVTPSLESNLSHQRKKHRDCGAFVGGEGALHLMSTMFLCNKSSKLIISDILQNYKCKSKFIT